MSAPPVKDDGEVVFGPTGVAVGELPDPPFPPFPPGLVAVPLLEPLDPDPVGELPVPEAIGFGDEPEPDPDPELDVPLVGAEPEPEPDPDPVPDPDPKPDVPLLGWLMYPVPDGRGRVTVDRVLSGQYVVVKVWVTVAPAEV